MMGFEYRLQCAQRVFCLTCRTDPEWRGRVGAPEACPHGVTSETAAAVSPEPAKESQGQEQAFGTTDRYGVCATCDQRVERPDGRLACRAIGETLPCRLDRMITATSKGLGVAWPEGCPRRAACETG